MTLLGERLCEWLRSQPDVTAVTDASTREYGDAIACHQGGASWMITLTPGRVLDDPQHDPREPDHWNDDNDDD